LFSGLIIGNPRAESLAAKVGVDLMRLDGKTALVTGAGSGIGKCIAETYAREGARVALADINRDAAKSAARTIGNNAIALRCDVSKKADITSVVDETLAAFGALDILVNNAGATHVNKPMLEIEEAEYDRIFAINVKGIFLACQAVVPVFRERGGGVIINIGSTAGLRPRPGLSAYNATKGAVHILTKSLAVELAPDGIRVCAIAPVATETPLLPSFLGPSQGMREKFVATIPMGRLALPQDIADAALFLASPQAKFVTGNIMEVDGGRTV
jgi:3-oxoacyl-[acyl-carrier protein] reductase